MTPLMAAAQRGQLAVVVWLLSQGADLTLKNRTGDTAYTLASKNNYLDVAEILFQEQLKREKERETNGFPFQT